MERVHMGREDGERGLHGKRDDQIKGHGKRVKEDILMWEESTNFSTKHLCHLIFIVLMDDSTGQFSFVCVYMQKYIYRKC